MHRRVCIYIFRCIGLLSVKQQTFLTCVSCDSEQANAIIQRISSKYETRQNFSLFLLPFFIRLALLSCSIFSSLPFVALSFYLQSPPYQIHPMSRLCVFLMDCLMVWVTGDERWILYEDRALGKTYMHSSCIAGWLIALDRGKR